MESKKITSNLDITFFILFVNGVKYLILQKGLKNKYLLIPSCLHITGSTTELIVQLISNEKHLLKSFKQFVKKVESYTRTFDVVLKKKIILKGLGFRATLIENLALIELKIGFSHLIQLSIPESLSVKLNKNTLVIEGSDKILLGNFVNKIVSLKRPDCYKAKGF